MHMTRRLAIMAMTGTLALAVSGSPVTAQQGAYAKLAGTWVMDSTTGPDDHGLPKSETLVFSTEGPALRIAATEDNGKGPGTSTFDCTAKAATGTAGPGVTTRCTVHPYADSVVYAVDVLKDGKVVAGERGRLVVSPSGTTLRDQYDATSGAGPATHHRHHYVKQS
jgi:hypothetical protein